MSIDTGQVLESEGADHIFRQSVVTRKLQYTGLYSEVTAKVTIKSTMFILQMEFKLLRKNIQDVQKQVRTALRKRKKENPALSGKGKLTDAMIDKLQNYYGIAVRSNA